MFNEGFRVYVLLVFTCIQKMGKLFMSMRTKRNFKLLICCSKFQMVSESEMQIINIAN